MSTKAPVMIKKSDGTTIPYDSQRIISYLESLTTGLNKDYLDLQSVEKKVRLGISQNMTTEELNIFLSETLAYLNILHPDYSNLAARVVVTRIHKTTEESVL